MHKPPEHSKIVVCGSARNISQNFPKTFEYLVGAFSGFDQTEFIICESFSSDITIEVLQEIESLYKNFTFFTDSVIDGSESRRTVRIASARNQLQNKIFDVFPHFDYVAMVDLDGVNRDLKRSTIESIWEFSKWDAAFANQTLRYYDIWALRASGWCERDWFQEYTLLLSSTSKRKAKKIALTSKMRNISRRASPILVESAFGGLGIYKMKTFLDGEYRGEDSNGMEICEHVYFHSTLTKKGHKLYIMPSLVNLNSRSQLINLLKEFILRVLRKVK